MFGPNLVGLRYGALTHETSKEEWTYTTKSIDVDLPPPPPVPSPHTIKALEFAQFRAFGVPSISKLFRKTGEFCKRAGKR